MTAAPRICTRCIMDTTVPDIEFSEQGVCNCCREYEEMAKRHLRQDETGRRELELLVADMKRKGANRDYDCVIGVSGGVDSTYVAYLIKKRFDLRPLAVHLDNGWDAELAVSNVESVLKKLSIDLYTQVLDWEQFKDLQVAFLKSSISSAEIPTDHAISATLFRVAADKSIPYIVMGGNVVTEGIMPWSWQYSYRDLRMIRAIHHKFGTTRIRDIPTLSFLDEIYYRVVKGIRTVAVLNYVPYVKADAKKLLQDELGWRDYGGKHYESVYTRFFQAYYLPRKFNIDKRKAHLSTLIMSGQISREEALKLMQEPPCPSGQLEEDGEYVMKKLGLGYEEFAGIMSSHPKSVDDYPNSASFRRGYTSLLKATKKLRSW